VRDTLIDHTSLGMYTLPTETFVSTEEEEAQPEGAISGNPLVDNFRKMDLDEIINNMALVGVAVAVGVFLHHIDATLPHHGVATLQDSITRIPMEAYQSYETSLSASPIATKAVTSATVYTIGDVISQRTEGTGIGELDRARILRSLLAGLIGHGPLSHYWYILLDG
jgi:hypothetical protein